MAKAKKLQSGRWNVQVYSHSELQYDSNGDLLLDAKGKPLMKKYTNRSRMMTRLLQN